MLLFGSLLLTTSAYGMNIRLLGDLAYTESTSESEERATGDVTKTESSSFQQTYRLDLTKEIFPTLNMNTGIQVEQGLDTNEVDDGPKTKNRNRQILPYIDLEWRNPLYSLSGGYRERYERSKVDSVDGTERDYVTSYNLRGEWRPVEFPRVEFSYLHTERHDDPFTSKSENDTWLVNTRYEYQDYSFRYSFLRGVNANKSRQTDEMRATEATTNTHSGEARFSRSFLDGKLNLNSSIRMEYTTQEFSDSDSNEAPVPNFGARFYESQIAPDDLDFANLPSGAVEEVDPLRLPHSSSGAEPFYIVFIEISEDATADKFNLRVSSVDTTTDVDFQSIEEKENWAIYTSDNQELWTSQIVDEVKEKEEEDNILEISFVNSITKPYIIAVYTPPLSSSPNASDVNISSVVPIVLTSEPELTNQTYQAQFGIGWQATEATRLSYTFNLQERRSSLFDERKTRLTNGLSISHIFNQIFTGTARVSSGHSWDQGALDTSNYSYSARLSGRYLDTLNQSLIYSGSMTQDKDDGDSTSNALVLRTNSAMYEGWDVSFDQGTTWKDSDSDSASNGYFVRLQTSVVPHSSYSLFAEYSIDWDNADGDTERSDTGRFRALWVPRDTLSFSGEVRVRRTADDDQLTWEYSASWLPLRDGSLQCVLAYSQEEDKDGNQTWSFSPSLTWDVTHYATLSLRYSLGEQETNEDINQFETAFLNFRIFYDN